MTQEQLVRYFDHTLLKASATESEIKKLCLEAKEWNFATVCVNPCRVTLAAGLLKGSEVGVCTVIGFPLGANTTNQKVQETQEAVRNGASEIDMVLNLGWVFDEDWASLEAEIGAVVGAHGLPVKVILETCYLENSHLVKACKIAEKAGAKFVKTSTGFGTAGATIEHVRLMRKSVSSSVQVKASGGIRNLEQTLALIEAGAGRIGASASGTILKEFLGQKAGSGTSGY